MLEKVSNSDPKIYYILEKMPRTKKKMIEDFCLFSYFEQEIEKKTRQNVAFFRGFDLSAKY